MKTLYLLRHAKSSWEQPLITDFDRPLTDRGYADAHLLGNSMHGKKIQINVILSSPAIRAMTTAIIVSQHINYSPDKILIREKLYDSKVEDYLDCIAAVDGGDSVLLTGHNNTISEVAQKLSINTINDLKTCTLIAIKLKIKLWKDIFDSKGDLLFEWHPGLLKNL